MSSNVGDVIQLLEKAHCDYKGHFKNSVSGW